MDSTARDHASPPEIGKYQLIAELARGGMGIVYLAALQGPGGFNKLLALKELKAELCDDDTYVAMFLDEARLAARLVHPNIVQTNEVGSEGKRHFMVMEFLDGRALHRVARRSGEGGRMPTGSLLRIIADSLQGLHHAHELCEFDGSPLGIVHRDVSPLNVFLTFEGQAKVLDFGIAKAVDSSLETATGVLKGRVAYMAPEQAWGNKVDRRADVYSTGVMIWECAAGRRLWPGMSEVEILARALREGPPTLRSVRPDVPADLGAICSRAMAKHAEDRYPTALALLEDLERHLARRDDVMTMREIGAFTAKMFTDERKKMAALVEKAVMRARNNGPRSGVMPAFDSELAGGTHSDRLGARDDTGHVSSRRVRTSTLPSPGSLRSDRTAPPASVPVEEIRKWPPHRAAFVASAGAALASIVIVLLLRGNAATPAPETAVATAVGVGRPAALPEIELIDLSIRVSPPSAQITIDGAPVPSNPFHARYSRDRTIHHIAASADGYDSKLSDVSFGGDVSIDVTLDRHPAPAPSPPPFYRRSAPPPPPPAHPAKKAAPQSADSSNTPAPTATQADVPPAGGHAPLRPISTSNPYGNP
ncbi:MAG TPA: serine/threonine-protein kinase [Polyangiaceae bacterium]|jgi:serine/threonine-protein kinase